MKLEREDRISPKRKSGAAAVLRLCAMAQAAAFGSIRFTSTLELDLLLLFRTKLDLSQGIYT